MAMASTARTVRLRFGTRATINVPPVGRSSSWNQCLRHPRNPGRSGSGSHYPQPLRPLERKARRVFSTSRCSASGAMTAASVAKSARAALLSIHPVDSASLPAITGAVDPADVSGIASRIELLQTIHGSTCLACAPCGAGSGEAGRPRCVGPGRRQVEAVRGGGEAGPYANSAKDRSMVSGSSVLREMTTASRGAASAGLQW
jgi:hypothetical protein